MADKLDWLNQHYILLLHEKSAEVVSAEGFKPSDEVKALLERFPYSEDLLHHFKAAGQTQDGCAFLAYNLHHRALVWWGYRCLLSLLQELKAQPDKPRDIAEIGLPRKPVSRPWAQPLPQKEMPTELEAELNASLGELQEAVQQVRAMVPKEITELFDEVLGVIHGQIKDEIGVTPDELFAQTIEKLKDAAHDEEAFDLKNSPIIKEEAELKARLEKMRQETIATIKAAIPQKSPSQQLRERKSALDATYAFILGPQPELAAHCLERGNACPDLEEGLLALCAFWAYGNLTPLADNVVRTPAGLAANGLNSLLLKAALHPGGTRKFPARFQLYLELGLKTAAGLELWPHSAQDAHTAPHAPYYVLPPQPQPTALNPTAASPEGAGAAAKASSAQPWAPN